MRLRTTPRPRKIGVVSTPLPFQIALLPVKLLPDARRVDVLFDLLDGRPRGSGFIDLRVENLSQRLAQLDRAPEHPQSRLRPRPAA